MTSRSRGDLAFGTTWGSQVSPTPSTEIVNTMTCPPALKDNRFIPPLNCAVPLLQPCRCFKALRLRRCRLCHDNQIGFVVQGGPRTVIDEWRAA
jgi:hypothetical protein